LTGGEHHPPPATIGFSSPDRETPCQMANESCVVKGKATVEPKGKSRIQIQPVMVIICAHERPFLMFMTVSADESEQMASEKWTFRLSSHCATRIET
jgi:hypothetical protein